MIFVLAILLVPASSCTPKYKASSAQRKTEKAQEKRKKETEKMIQEGQKKHLKAQTSDARKRMKQTKRKSEDWSGVKQPFYKRWWRKVFK